MNDNGFAIMASFDNEDAEESTGVSISVPPENILPNPFQPRKIFRERTCSKNKFT